MTAISLTESAPVVPEYADYAALRGHGVGLTGARGVLGHILKERLERQGIECASFGGDINDGAELSAWFAQRRLAYFFHFAALVPVTAVEGNPKLAFQTNVIGTYNVCKGLLDTQPGCWLFHCSSSHVYEATPTTAPIDEEAPKRPPTFYGATKLAAEGVVETLMGKLKFPYCIGRVFSFTHADQLPPYLVPSLRQKISALHDGDTLEIDNPSSVRDIQDAEQVIDVILHLARRRAEGTVNIGTGVGQSVRDIALSVARSLGKRIGLKGTDRGPTGSLIADISRLRKLLSPPESPTAPRP